MAEHPGIDRTTVHEGEPTTAATPGPEVDRPRGSRPPGVAAARAGAVVLLASGVLLFAVGALLVLSWRLAWIGMPVVGWSVLVCRWSLVTCLHPGRASDRWTMAVGLGSAVPVVASIRMLRPLDETLGVAVAVLTALLAASGLLAWSRLAPVLATGARPRVAMAASAAAGVALVVIAALAPLADQPPFAPLRLSAVAVVDAECGWFHVDDPRGMGSVGFDSVEPAPEGWRRRRGTLVLQADRQGWFEADGQRLALEPSHGLSACSRGGSARHRQVARPRISRPSPPSAAR